MLPNILHMYGTLTWSIWKQERDQIKCLVVYLTVNVGGEVDCATIDSPMYLIVSVSVEREKADVQNQLVFLIFKILLTFQQYFNTRLAMVTVNRCYMFL